MGDAVSGSPRSSAPPAHYARSNQGNWRSRATAAHHDALEKALALTPWPIVKELKARGVLRAQRRCSSSSSSSSRLSIRISGRKVHTQPRSKKKRKKGGKNRVLGPAVPDVGRASAEAAQPRFGCAMET